MLRVATIFHDTYEELAPKHCYETRPETREFNPFSANGKLMQAVIAKLVDDGVIQIL